MLKRLVVSLDGSRSSSRAIPYAAELAEHFGAEAILLHVRQSAIRSPTTASIAPGSQSPAGAAVAARVAPEVAKRNTACASHSTPHQRQRVRWNSCRDWEAGYKN
jgi:nucleotide-binding universal stress UspA family protein